MAVAIFSRFETISTPQFILNIKAPKCSKHRKLKCTLIVIILVMTHVSRLQKYSARIMWKIVKLLSVQLRTFLLIYKYFYVTTATVATFMSLVWVVKKDISNKWNLFHEKNVIVWMSQTYKPYWSSCVLTTKSKIHFTHLCRRFNNLFMFTLFVIIIAWFPVTLCP